MGENGIWRWGVLSKVIHAQKDRCHMFSFLKNPSFNFMGFVFNLRVLVEVMKLGGGQIWCTERTLGRKIVKHR